VETLKNMLRAVLTISVVVGMLVLESITGPLGKWKWVDVLILLLLLMLVGIGVGYLRYG
jgi:ABC-type polysaccharide/polyol phosphate export permease